MGAKANRTAGTQEGIGGYIHKLWEGVEAPTTGDYERDCVEFAVTALTNIGYSGFRRRPFSPSLTCDGDGKRISVCVLPLGVEDFEMTLDDLHELIDDFVVEIGSQICIADARATGDDVPPNLRFDVMSVCLNPSIHRVRIHHVRSVWES